MSVEKSQDFSNSSLSTESKNTYFDLLGARTMANVHVIRPQEESSGAQEYASPVERIYYEWDKALSQNDAEALTELYADDATIESPLIPHLLGKKEGVCRGKGELREFFEAVATRKPPVRQYHRTGYLTDGKRVIWEYPREGSRGDQMDFAEAMELNDKGEIQRHCVYWGWFGFGVLQRDEYHS
jgi:hypothetical protein